MCLVSQNNTEDNRREEGKTTNGSLVNVGQDEAISSPTSSEKSPGISPVKTPVRSNHLKRLRRVTEGEKEEEAPDSKNQSVNSSKRILGNNRKLEKQRLRTPRKERVERARMRKQFLVDEAELSGDDEEGELGDFLTDEDEEDEEDEEDDGFVTDSTPTPSREDGNLGFYRRSMMSQPFKGNSSDSPTWRTPKVNCL
jgi:hypothetical protein